MLTSVRTAAGAMVVAMAFAGCDGGSPSDLTSTFDLDCSIPTRQLLDGGVGVDGIPALTDPRLVSASSSEELSYLRDRDRVIAFVAGGEAYAIPHNILWWHEIVNLTLPGGERIAVTYCPLTGSSMVFDRAAIGGAELGVSGLLFQTNLIMYDRSTNRSLWPQMMSEARCGPADGSPLPMMAAFETTWEGWKELYPETRVVSGVTGIPRNYTQYPYGNYEVESNGDLLFPLGKPMDARRMPKERVLAVPSRNGTGGIALPFRELDRDRGAAVVEVRVDGEDIVVLWESRVQGAMAFRPLIAGVRHTFVAEGDEIRDVETGSLWRMDGVAVQGPLSGVRLDPVSDAYVAFWFAWAVFRPETELWTHP